MLVHNHHTDGRVPPLSLSHAIALRGHVSVLHDCLDISMCYPHRVSSAYET